MRMSPLSPPFSKKSTHTREGFTHDKKVVFYKGSCFVTTLVVTVGTLIKRQIGNFCRIIRGLVVVQKPDTVTAVSKACPESHQLLQVLPFTLQHSSGIKP